MRPMFARLLVSGLVLGPLLFACQPLEDYCAVSGTGDAVGLDEVGPPGFAAVDVVVAAGTYEVHDGDYDLVVTLDWADEATPRQYRWVDDDGDGELPEASCPLDYLVRGTLTVDSGDGRYQEVASGDVVASEGGAPIWFTIPARDVNGDEVPGKELWLEIFDGEDGPRFALTAVAVGGRADYLVDAPLEPSPR